MTKSLFPHSGKLQRAFFKNLFLDIYRPGAVNQFMEKISSLSDNENNHSVAAFKHRVLSCLLDVVLELCVSVLKC